MTITENITGLQHVGLPTNDMEATYRFYESLGFTVALDTINEKANERVVFFRMGDLLIEAYENHQAALVDGALEHIALNVRDIEAAYAYTQFLGYPALEGTIQFLPFWTNGVKYFTIRGANHEKVEFSQRL